MMMVRQCLFTAVACLGLSTGLILAQSPGPESNQSQSLDQATMTTHLSTSSVQVAEPFWLEFKCVVPANTTVNFPAVMKKFGDLDVVDHQDQFDIPLDSSPELRGWTRRLTLESIVTGNLNIPTIEVQLAHGSQSKRLASKPQQLSVLSVLEDRAGPKSFRDLKPLADIEIESRPSSLGSHGRWVDW